MATKLPEVDILLVGFGWTSAIMAQELAETGLSILALERSAWRDTPADMAPTFDQDELRYYWRQHLFQNVSHDTLTIRNNTSQTALPMRRLGSFLLGTGVGGAGVHWNGQIWRFLPSDFLAKSHNAQRYGPQSVTQYDMTVQDWGVTYEELEPHYDTFDKLCGTAGKAGNLRGQIQPGGNPFEGPRQNEFPAPPLPMTYAPTLFAKAASEVGYHPFPHPAGNMSQPYQNPLGAQLGQCTYCGFCEKFACGNYSKATPQTTLFPSLFTKPNFTLKTGAEVLKINLDSNGKRAVSVTYVDGEGREWEQPAGAILLGAYILHNVRLLLLSGIGKPYNPQTGEGVVGKNYAYQITSSVHVFYDDKILNPFIGAGALGMVVDDFNGDNFDHSGKGFIGGGYIALLTTNGRPVEWYAGSHIVPKDTPNWGPKWKAAVAKNYLKSATLATHGAVMSHRGNYLDLDPTYRDIYGRPMLRMTFDYTDNEHKMSDFLTDRATDIAKAMRPREFRANPRKGSWSVVPYQTTHNTGGAIMGATPQDSVVNTYMQSWDVPNLFVMGAGAFPQNPGYNPTATVAALTYRAAAAIKSQYLKAPGALVQA